MKTELTRKNKAYYGIAYSMRPAGWIKSGDSRLIIVAPSFTELERTFTILFQKSLNRKLCKRVKVSKA